MIIVIFLAGLPPPRKVILERQLNNSVVLSWLPPSGVPDTEIYGYAIKANGLLKQTLIGAARTKAIVSDIDRDKVRSSKSKDSTFLKDK